MNPNAYAFALLLKQRNEQLLQSVSSPSLPLANSTLQMAIPVHRAPQLFSRHRNETSSISLASQHTSARPMTGPHLPPQQMPEPSTALFSSSSSSKLQGSAGHIDPLVLSPSSQTAASFFCSSCAKAFPGPEALRAHLQTHEQCTHPGCAFCASRKALQAHAQTSHGQYSGQGLREVEVEGRRFPILLGTSPEDVARWREERRLKFPTAHRAESKQSAEERLWEAGGVDAAPSASKRRRLEEGVERRDGERGGREGEAQEALSGRVCKFFARGRCKRGGRCKLLHCSAQERASRGSDKYVQEEKESASIVQEGRATKGRLPVARNLFRKLIAREVQGDESLLLQALRLLSQRNFLQEAT